MHVLQQALERVRWDDNISEARRRKSIVSGLEFGVLTKCKALRLRPGFGVSNLKPTTIYFQDFLHLSQWGPSQTPTLGRGSRASDKKCPE